MPSNRVRERLRKGAPISEIMTKPALTMHELALVLDLSMQFVYRMLQNDIGPATFYIGRTRYVRMETLRAWLAERERLAEAEKKPA